MLLNAFLTEYDEGIGSELNVDPLGLLVIWSAFGQQIFRNRVSSISNDVRNYTLNLFNHWLIRELIDDDRVVLGSSIAKRYSGKQDLNFKYACLLYLENLYVYSILNHEQQEGVQSVGVLGISKARRRWHESDKNPLLLFSHEPKAQVLVRQLLLGVSGRYKTPLVEMGFFDRLYNYSLPDAAPLWDKTRQLIDTTPVLNKLTPLLKQHLEELLRETHNEPRRKFGELQPLLTQALTNAFSSPATVGKYARDFWLSVTELDQGASGALYQALQPASGQGSLNTAGTADLFAVALQQELPMAERTKLEHIRLLEPMLAELDLLFTLILSESTQLLSDVQKSWRALGRDAGTLAKLAQPIAENTAMFAGLSAVGRSRLKRLLDVACCTNEQTQVRELLAYHGDVMESRGQSPWLNLREGKQLKLQVRPRRAPTKDGWPLGSWVNQYYIPQFRNLLSGLLGVAA